MKCDNGVVTTTSINVADYFSKQHKNVMQAIQELQCSEEFRRLNFQPSFYMSTQGKPTPMYDMTKDGFMFLVLGFTGEKAGGLKEDYILKFNEMERELNSLSTTEGLLRAVQKLVDIEREQRRLTQESLETKAEVKQLTARIDNQPIQGAQKKRIYSLIQQLGEAIHPKYGYGRAHTSFNKCFCLEKYDHLPQFKADEAVEWLLSEIDRRRKLFTVNHQNQFNWKK